MTLYDVTESFELCINVLDYAAMEIKIEEFHSHSLIKRAISGSPYSSQNFDAAS
jgi:hypothetical protein